jgi:hypothetical protein
MRQSNLRFWPSRRSGSDHRVPEEHSKKTNHNNAKDKAPRVAKTSCVVGSRPVGIAHAKLLGRPQANLTRHFAKANLLYAWFAFEMCGETQSHPLGEGRIWRMPSVPGPNRNARLGIDLKRKPRRRSACLRSRRRRRAMTAICAFRPKTGVDGLCSLMGQWELFWVSTPRDACVLCASVGLLSATGS